jgi:methylated-DNA-[protein]-cysteine S-methyltransferase
MTSLQGLVSATVSAPFGSVLLHVDEAGLRVIDVSPEPSPSSLVAANSLLVEVVRQFGCYFADARFQFAIPSVLRGTPHQRTVWDALRRIPAGSTRTYGELAREVGSSARVVAAACRSNPLPIIIPCHRVVGQRSLGGYCGDTSGPRFAIKLWLLHHEGSLAAF